MGRVFRAVCGCVCHTHVERDVGPRRAQSGRDWPHDGVLFAGHAQDARRCRRVQANARRALSRRRGV